MLLAAKLACSCPHVGRLIMSKRQHGQLELRPRDFYATPLKAVLPLIPHLEPGCRFYEPCAGAGDLVDHLVAHGMVCAGASDIEPQRDDISVAMRCSDRRRPQRRRVQITNSPYSKTSRRLTLALLFRLSALRPTWLLLPADFAHNVYAGPILAGCDRIVSIGRVRWIAGSTTDGLENSAWFRFDARHSDGPRFFPRLEGQRHGLQAGGIPVRE